MDSSIYLNSQTFEFPGKTKLTVTHKKVLLTLRTSFGTSHSSTTVRSNSFIQILLEDSKMYGLGEVGLPPKKPYCYLADNNDINEYLNSYFEHLNTLLKSDTKITKSSIKNWPFSPEINAPLFILFLIYAMDTCPANSKEFSKAARNGLECAVLDLLCKINKIALCELLCKTKPQNVTHSSFYTVGMASDEEMIQSLQFGLKYTPFIKIKLNKDHSKSKHNLELIYENYMKIMGKDKIGKWSVDLNSDFDDPLDCEKFINDILSKYKGLIYMVEQPFPVKVEDWTKWKNIKIACQKYNFELFADESVSTADSIEKIHEIVTGVNIKLEKCGGHRAALQAIEKAKSYKLLIWIGTMVGSSLLTNMGVAITPHAVFSDLDGELLIIEESQPCTRGFIWEKEKMQIKLSTEYGVGVSLKKFPL